MCGKCNGTKVFGWQGKVNKEDVYTGIFFGNIFVNLIGGIDLMGSIAFDWVSNSNGRMDSLAAL